MALSFPFVKKTLRTPLETQPVWVWQPGDYWSPGHWLRGIAQRCHAQGGRMVVEVARPVRGGFYETRVELVSPARIAPRDTPRAAAGETSLVARLGQIIEVIDECGEHRFADVDEVAL
jgi:hypothetical protein